MTSCGFVHLATGGTVSARDVHELYREVNKFVLVSVSVRIHFSLAPYNYVHVYAN